MKVSRAARAAQAARAIEAKNTEEQAIEVQSSEEQVVEVRSEPERPALIYPLPRQRRLLIAFLIGLPTTLMFPFAAIPSPIFWSLDIPLLVLIVTLFLAISRDPIVKERRIEQRRVMNNMVAAIVLMVVYFLAEIILLDVGGTFSLIGLVLIPIVVGLVVGFSLSGGQTRRQSSLYGVLAWAGAAIANLLAITYNLVAVFSNPEYARLYPKYTLESALVSQLGVVLLIHLMALVICGWGAQLGWRARKRLLGSDSVLDEEPAKVKAA